VQFCAILEECIKDEILEQSAQKEKIRRFLDELRQTNHLVTEFNENLWNASIELVTVHSDKTLSFRFKDGTQISVKPAGK
jgi:site-specific DNA recombinase